MLYRTIPSNGDRLSILGFGCMRLPMAEGHIDEARGTCQIRHAIDAGVNYIDTAWPYHAGESEPFLGRALSDGYREKVRLATKLPAFLVEIPADMDRFLDAQLRRLRTQRIDYYLLHSLTGPLWDHIERLGVLRFLDRAKEDGRIANAGFSFHGTPGDFERIVDAYPWQFCQIQYNFLDEEYQAGTRGLEYAASRGLGVIVMEPLRGGNLAVPEAPPSVAAAWNEAPVKRTPAEWALRWVWNHPEVTVVLSGMNDEAHIRENLSIAGEALPGSLTDVELALVKRAAQKYKELMKIGCTGCGYCTPCPAGVAIPSCFEVYNKMYLSGNIPEALALYAMRNSGILRKGVPSYASQCVECGQCLAKCPQNLPIPTLLKQVAAELEVPGLEERVARARKMLNME
jgi:predicted aldo/keto reductase-like oxidoreductase